MKTSAVSWFLVAVALCAACSKKDDPNNALPNIDVGDAATSDTALDADTGSSEREAILAVPVTKETTIPALRAEVQVIYTEGNVPHIYAQNLHDAHVAEGFIMGRERFFEFDIGSRLATGQVSELLGGFGLQADLASRARGTTAIADNLVANAGESTNAAWDALAEGFNAYTALVKAGELPPPSEYDIAAPLVGESDASNLLRTIDRRAMAGFASFAIFESVFTDYDVSSEVIADTIPGHFAGAPLEALRQAGIEQDFFPAVTPQILVSTVPGWGLNGQLASPLSWNLPRPTTPGVGRDLGTLPPSLRERLSKLRSGNLWFATRDPSDRGSNAWAVSGEGTADGSTLFAADGHLSLGVPTLFMQMGVDVRTFGDDALRTVGLYLPGVPPLAVGTNGDIAWSQTFPRADVMDWYQEELQLDANGMPVASLFKGTYEPLVKIDEMYKVGKILVDDPYDAVWPRWTTFDGRTLQEVEGRSVADIETEVLAAGESIIATRSGFVVPADEDGDGIITAISLDYTAYDARELVALQDRLQRSQNVEDFLDTMRGFVGYAQNLTVVDRSGSVGFSNFSVTPCRDYLPRGADGRWVDGADPQRLIDGTQYGGFEVPYADGLPATGDADPQRCMIDYDVFPRITRATGYVVQANEDPAGATFDNNHLNDPAYIGGPWVPGYRARTIRAGLDAATARGATLDDMLDIQNGQRSEVGFDLSGVVIGAIANAKAAQAADPATLSEADVRARDLYASRSAELDEAIARMQAWLDAGGNPASGVETFYSTPTDQDRVDAVATTIFNAWLRQWIAAVFADEQIDFLLRYPGRARGAMLRPIRSLVEGRGAANPMDLASWNPATEESVYFDDMTTPNIIEENDEIAIGALIATLDYLASPQTSGANGGFGTADMSKWLWGLRHRVELDSLLAAFGADTAAVSLIAQRFAITTKVLPLADSLPDGDPRLALKWFPRPGDLFGVDAGNPSYFLEDNFDYSDGPVFRMSFELSGDGGVKGHNVVPAGQSGLADSPHFADQAALWLGNKTLDVQWAPKDVAAAAIGREVLKP